VFGFGASIRTRCLSSDTRVILMKRLAVIFVMVLFLSGSNSASLKAQSAEEQSQKRLEIILRDLQNIETVQQQILVNQEQTLAEVKNLKIRARK
jgi:hypothetical protein